MIQCKNCKACPSKDSKVILNRINPKGIVGEWICVECLDNFLEIFKEIPHYMHSRSCGEACEYGCNGNFGFDLAEQIAKYHEKYYI